MSYFKTILWWKMTPGHTRLCGVWMEQGIQNRQRGTFEEEAEHAHIGNLGFVCGRFNKMDQLYSYQSSVIYGIQCSPQLLSSEGLFFHERKKCFEIFLGKIFFC
jgi:hypothetical protein